MRYKVFEIISPRFSSQAVTACIAILMASLLDHDWSEQFVRGQDDSYLLPCIIATVAPGDSNISQPSYRCNFCHYATEDKELINLHVSDHFFRCKYCPFYTDRQHELLNHYKIRHGKPYSLPYHLICLDEHKMSVTNKWRSLPLLLLGQGSPTKQDSLKYSVPKDGYISNTVISDMEQVNKLGPVKTAQVKVTRTAHPPCTAAAFRTTLVADNVGIQNGALAISPSNIKKAKLKTVKSRKLVKASESRTLFKCTPEEIYVATATSEPFRIVVPTKITRSLRLLSAYSSSSEDTPVCVTPSVVVGKKLSEAQDINQLPCYTDTLSKNVMLFYANSLEKSRISLHRSVSPTNTDSLVFKQAMTLVGNIPGGNSSDITLAVKCLVQPTKTLPALQDVRSVELVQSNQSNVGANTFKHGIITKVITPLEEAASFPAFSVMKSKPLSVTRLESAFVHPQLPCDVDDIMLQLPLQHATETSLPQTATSSKEHIEFTCDKMVSSMPHGEWGKRVKTVATPSIFANVSSGIGPQRSDIHDSTTCAEGGKDSAYIGLKMASDCPPQKRRLRSLPSRRAASSIWAKKNRIADVTSSESATSQTSPRSVSSLSSEYNAELESISSTATDEQRLQFIQRDLTKTSNVQDYRPSSRNMLPSFWSNNLKSCAELGTDPYAFEESCEQLHEDHWNMSRKTSGSRQSSTSSNIDKLQSSSPSPRSFQTDHGLFIDCLPKRNSSKFSADNFFSDEEDANVAGPSVAGPSVARPSVARSSVARPSVADPSVAEPSGNASSHTLSAFSHPTVMQETHAPTEGGVMGNFKEKKPKGKLASTRRGWRAKTEHAGKQPLRRMPPTPPRRCPSEVSASASTDALTPNTTVSPPMSNLGSAPYQYSENLESLLSVAAHVQTESNAKLSIKSRLGPEVRNKDLDNADDEQKLVKPKLERVTRQSSVGHLPQPTRSPLVTRSASLNSLGSPDSAASTGSITTSHSSLPSPNKSTTKRRRSTNADSPRRRAPTRGLALIRHALSGLMTQPPLPKRARHSVPPVDQGLFDDLSDGDRVPDLLLNLQTRHLSPSPNNQLLRRADLVQSIEDTREFVAETIEPVERIVPSRSHSTDDCSSQTEMDTDDAFDGMPNSSPHMASSGSAVPCERPQSAPNTMLSSDRVRIDINTARAEFELNQVSLLQESQSLFQAKKLLPVLVHKPKSSLHKQAARSLAVQIEVISFQTSKALNHSNVKRPRVPRLVSHKLVLPMVSQCTPVLSANPISRPTYSKPMVESVVWQTGNSSENVLKSMANSVTEMTSSNMDHYVTIDETSDDTDSLPLDTPASYCPQVKRKKSKADMNSKGYRPRNQLQNEPVIIHDQWDSDDLSDIVEFEPVSIKSKAKVKMADNFKSRRKSIDGCGGASSNPKSFPSIPTVVQAAVAPVVVEVEKCATTMMSSIGPSKSVSAPESKVAGASFHSLKSRLQLAVQKGALTKNSGTADSKAKSSSKQKHGKDRSHKSKGDRAKSDGLGVESGKIKKQKKKHKHKHKDSKPELSESKRPSKKLSPVKISHTANKSCIVIQSKPSKKHRRVPVTLEESLIFYPVPTDNSNQNKNDCKLAKLNNTSTVAKVKPSHAAAELSDARCNNHEKKRKSQNSSEQPKHKKSKPSQNKEGSSSNKSKERPEKGSSKPRQAKLPWCDKIITDVLRCELCDFICLEKNDLIEHKQEVHAAKVAPLAPCEYDPVVNQNVQYKCTLCGLADDQLRSIRTHITAEHGGKLHSCERVTHTRTDNGFSLLVESVRVYKD